MTKNEALKANPFAEALASYKDATGTIIYFAAGTEREAWSWLSFNKDYAQAGSQKVQQTPVNFD